MRGPWASVLILIAVSIFAFANPVAAAQTYKVRSGDNLAKIAKKYHVSVADLKAANDLKGNDLKVRQTLVIPGKGKKQGAKSSKKEQLAQKQKKDKETASSASETESYVVKKGDTVRSIAEANGITVAQFKRMNHMGKKTRLKKGQEVLVPAKPSPEEDEPGEIDPSDVVPETVAPGTPSAALGKWKDPDERSLFIKVVKSFLGVPYKLGGNSVRGIDCSAFVRKLYEIFDVSLPRTAREQSLTGKRVVKSELQEGDIVFFKTRRDHVGIYVGNNQFVHMSYRSRQAKVDNMDSQYFANRFIRGVRIKELVDMPISQAKIENSKTLTR